MKRALLKTVFACLLAAGLTGYGYMPQPHRAPPSPRDMLLCGYRQFTVLGYERVQDTETGEYYRAENGFTDWYGGTRYRPATGNAAYLTPVSGYINWK
ncbi:MAG: hypothetical protein IJ658_02700 [Kiritimatiellae bacterium]|nr:hypothetical protein [Kiritimatiellia bacterium]